MEKECGFVSILSSGTKTLGGKKRCKRVNNAKRGQREGKSNTSSARL